MLNVAQFRADVVAPVLSVLGQWNAAMNSAAAANLLVGTALQESSLTDLKQVGGGPALGVMQIEPASHNDVWTNYLDFRNDLAGVVKGLSAGGSSGANAANQLPWNLGYSVAIARVIYWRVPDALPDADDIQGLGQFWKDHYNTPGGAGTAAQWVANYQRYAAG